jgi:hypothetical protein
VERPDEDVVEALGYAFARLGARLAVSPEVVGPPVADPLGDDEWVWSPIPGDDRVSIRWRLDHIASLLAEPRCRTWLGLPEETAIPLAPASGAADAVARVRRSFADLDDAVRRVDLTREVGAVAAPYGSATRRSFVLHLLDELVHHAAEVALLRDLWAASLSAPRSPRSPR